MRRFALALLLVIMVAAFMAAALQPTSALPEYSEQTGEPCATCHASPSGGGIRTPRGQAWVGEGRSGTVLPLLDALAFLGVKLTVDEADFVAPVDAATPAQPFPPASAAASELGDWLRNHEGN